MADKNVQMPDGSVVAFPDSMSDDAIAAVLKSQHPAAQQDRPNGVQKFADDLTRYVEHPEDRGAGQPNALNRFAGGVLRGSIGVLAHPYDAAQGALQSMNYSPQAAHQAAANDPGVAATVGGLVGGAALGEAVRPMVAPVLRATVGGAKRAVLLGKTPEAAYESALKPSTTLSSAERAAVVKTGLENQIPVSKGGLESLGELIGDYNQKIKDVIDSDPTRPIDPNKVATRADTARAKFAQQVNAGGDLNAIEASKQQFLAEQGATPTTPAPPMNAADAQAMKQGTYRVLSGKFGEQGSAAVEAQKALARGLKEEIATQFPEITKLNADESRLLDLQPVLERAVNRISNHQAIGIGTPVAGAAAKAITGSGGVGVVASALKGVLDNPFVKSKLAIAVSKGAKIPFSQAAARVDAYSSALGSAAGVSQVSSGDQKSSGSASAQ